VRVVFDSLFVSKLSRDDASQVHRHIEVLNQIGINAFLSTPETSGITADDFLVLGEEAQEMPNFAGADRCGKVILCHNAFRVMSGFKGDTSKIKEIYRESAGILCPSANIESSLKFMASSTPVYRYRYSFDRGPWAYSGKKDRIVCVSSVDGTANAVMLVSRLKWMNPGWKVMSIDDLSELALSDTFKRSSIFMAVGEKEGFGILSAGAMACGCTVVGYRGSASSEFMIPGISFPVPNGEYIEMTKTLLEVVDMADEDRFEIGRNASEFIRSSYSTKAEVDSIKAAWSKITRPIIDVRTEASERMKREVAVYMPVYNEGPYLETLLKWLIPRVGAIYVAESIAPWSPNGQPGGASKEVVDKVILEISEASKIIKYLTVGNNYQEEPLKREANQRNETLAEIRKDGWKFVWMVEADEFYRNREAASLWAWFFDRVNDGARVASSKWHTYWRSVHYRIEPQEDFRPNVAFLSDCKFDHGRIMVKEDERFSVYVPDRVCVVRHYSWARSPSDIQRKLSAWGHAKELIPFWYENVFLKWKPGSKMTNLHPTNPASYKSVVECNFPVPEAMKGHPFLGQAVIEDQGVSKVMSQVLVKHESTMACINPNAKATIMAKDNSIRLRIKAVIMHHNKPENADLLYEKLITAFDDVEIFDNGSDPNLVPIHVTRSRDNVYWTGTWNEVLATCSDYDAVWVLGCDITLLDDPKAYRDAIESSLPFGCWSPCIRGRSHFYMQSSAFPSKQPKSVKNIEGVALAMSGELIRKVKELVPGSKIGFGQDLWLCYRARQEGMKNIIDGRVVIHHPEGIGYSEAEAHKQMDETFVKIYGPNYRNAIFEYDDRPEKNHTGEKSMPVNSKIFTIVTVDNGWGLTEFIRITSKIKDCRRIVMQKGIGGEVAIPGVEFVPYDSSLEALKDADVALFSRVGAANKEDYLKLFHKGVAIVVKDSCAQGVIEHEKNGWLFQVEEWAQNWLSFLQNNPSERDRLMAEAKKRNGNEITDAVIVQEPQQSKSCKVTVITPTYRRDLNIIRRCIDCMLLQTEKNWEQIICSDGSKEDRVEGLVNSFNDPRIRYCNTVGKKEGDYGNTVRSEMMKQANGDYILFFDDDNIILPNYLERMLSAIESDKADFSVCQIMHFGPLNEKVLGKPPIVLTGDQVKLYHIDPLQVLVKREIMQKVGWDTKVGYLSDGVSLERLAPYKKVSVNEVLGVHT